MPSLPTNPSAENWLHSMTLEQKIGQLMLIGFDRTSIDADLREMITRYHVGGIILFARNVQSPQQVAELTSQMQTLARESGHPGLFLAIDQEGGRVARLTEDKGFTEFPAAMALTATGDPQNAYRAAAEIATEMRAVGLNADFAPDLDVNNNPDNPIIGIRSFGANPQQAAEYGLAFALGLQENGILAFGKHFPGHGDTSLDSHIDLPLVPHDRARLDAVELVPFRVAIAAGITGIMTAHVTFPAIDSTPGLPATLSRPALTGLLRQQMGFEGLIITDSLEMGALARSGYPPEQGATLALAAGADLLLFNRDHTMHRAAFDNLLAAVSAEKISIEQVNASVTRILEAKQRFGLLNPPSAPAVFSPSAVFSTERREFSRQLARQSLTLLRDPHNLLPLQNAPAPLLLEPASLRGQLTRLGLNATLLEIDDNPSRSQQADALHAAQNGRVTIVPLASPGQSPALLTLINDLSQAGHPPLVILYRDPFAANALPADAAVLLTYGLNPPTMEALAGLLQGKFSPTGILPLNLP